MPAAGDKILPKKNALPSFYFKQRFLRRSGATRETQSRAYFPSSSVLRYAAQTASIASARNAPDSSACTPAIVVPPGLHTAFSAPRDASPLEHHPRGAGDRLRRVFKRPVVRQAARHAAVCKRLDKQIGKRRAAAGNGARRVDQLFSSILSKRPAPRMPSVNAASSASVTSAVAV